MKRVRAWRGILGSTGVLLGAYLLFMLVLAPATLLDAGLAQTTGGRLRVAQAQGTLWSGSAQLEIRNGGGQRVASETVRWALQSGGWWRGRLDYVVATDAAAQPFRLSLSRHGVALAKVDVVLPARALGVAVPRLAPLEPQGRLAMHVTRLTLADGLIAADGVAIWQDASSALSAVAPLGTYELRFHSGTGPVQVTLRTRSGPLQLEGAGVWHGGALALTGTARVATPYRARLVPLLRLVAVERGDGTFALSLHPPLGTAAGRQAMVDQTSREPEPSRSHPISAAGGD